MKNFSGILDQVVKIKKVKKNKASHYALCNGNKVRYIISVSKEGKRRLSKNISTYSGKLELLMKLLPIIPFSFFSILRMGYFVDVILESEVDEVVSKTETKHWNIIIGTYGPQQKLVFQCFNFEESAIYIKIGNKNTSDKMKNETNFLSCQHSYQNFKIPEYVPINTTGNRFFYQVTKEFNGEKVEPVLNKDIIRIYKEISATQSDDKTEFSHGDFAPWNLKKANDDYIVFDWEFCGMRMKGFDLMHYVFSIKLMLENKSFDDAYEDSIVNIKEYISDFRISKDEFIREYTLIRK